MISGAEVAVIRHLMGHSVDSLGEVMGVNPRTIRAWETGRDEMSESAEAALREHLARHSALVEAMVQADTPILIPRNPTGPLPRGYYVAVTARAMDRDPNLMVDWHV